MCVLAPDGSITLLEAVRRAVELAREHDLAHVEELRKARDNGPVPERGTAQRIAYDAELRRLINAEVTRWAIGSIK